MSATVRNVLIVLTLAAVVAFAPGGGTSAGLVSTVLSLIFLGGVVWFAARMYMERRSQLYSLGERNRALLYGAVAVAFFCVASANRLWQTGAGTAVWFVLVAAAVYALFHVYRAATRY